jgi:hypothetical protein
VTNSPTDRWPWLALVGLGLFHGINPAMGWLFAVALGLHRRSQAIVLAALVPIALGHAVAVAAVLAAFLALGLLVDHAILMRLAAVVLIGWALWHALYGHRQRVRVGMQTGLIGLALWSFLMASAHGAGLMLIPVVAPLCISNAPGQELTTGAVPIAIAALGVHTAAMLATIALIALLVYHVVGIAFLRRGWINLDFVWVAALVVSGLVLLVVATN